MYILNGWCVKYPVGFVFFQCSQNCYEHEFDPLMFFDNKCWKHQYCQDGRFSCIKNQILRIFCYKMVEYCFMRTQKKNQNSEPIFVGRILCISYCTISPRLMLVTFLCLPLLGLVASSTRMMFTVYTILYTTLHTIVYSV